MEPGEKPAIRVQDLTKKFGSFTAVDAISFEVPQREIFGLLGPNGAGKSTTIRVLCTLTRPTSGTVEVAGHDVVKQDGEVRRHIGLVSEKMIMYDDLTARENLTLFGQLYDIPKDVLGQRIQELLAFVRMEKWADGRIGLFSTGMKQRINVIRAMLNEPEILFLDEPTLGLDPQSTVEIRQLIQRINSERGATIVLTTHEMTEADLLCHRIGIVDRGKVVALDTPAKLKQLVTGTDSRTFELRIPNLTPEVVASVRSLPCVSGLTQEDPTRLKLNAAGDDGFDTVVDTLRRSNVRIESASAIEPTLEDVFIHITGRPSLQQPGEGPGTGTSRGPRWQRPSRPGVR